MGRIGDLSRDIYTVIMLCKNRQLIKYDLQKDKNSLGLLLL